ncbi:hypothetical protein A5658_09345 [Mycobacterium sp. 1245111.1]|nr:hypothetical protein [Mycobacterium sp. 1245111.1]OBK35679.1 hypothetical protein A5658_09345 [Mycobacterium sp. 1245111.1]
MRSSRLWSYLPIGQSASHVKLFEVRDLLHEGRTARVPITSIGTIVAGWLADLDVSSPLVDDLTRAVQNGDWPAAYAVGEHLSVHVAVAA